MDLSLPSTRLGWWSVGLAATFVVVFIINLAVLLPASGAVVWREAFVSTVLLLSGLCGLVLGLVAVIRRHECSWLVWLATLPGLLFLFLVLGELALAWWHGAFG